MLPTVLPALCSVYVFNLNIKNVNALIARRLSVFTFTCSLTCAMNSKFSITHIEISRPLLVNTCGVNPDNSLAECVNL